MFRFASNNLHYNIPAIFQRRVNAFCIFVLWRKFRWTFLERKQKWLTDHSKHWYWMFSKKEFFIYSSITAKNNGLPVRTNSLSNKTTASSSLDRNSKNNSNKFSGFGRFFKPWKWRRKKKSEKFEAASKCKWSSGFQPQEFLVFSIGCTGLICYSQIVF